MMGWEMIILHRLCLFTWHMLIRIYFPCELDAKNRLCTLLFVSLSCRSGFASSKLMFTMVAIGLAGGFFGLPTIWQQEKSEEVSFSQNFYPLWRKTHLSRCLQFSDSGSYRVAHMNRLLVARDGRATRFPVLVAEQT